MEEFETNKLIADIISSNVESLYNTAKSFIIDKNNQLKARLRSTFTDYIKSIERKYSSTKTIIYRDTPQSIKGFYEPIDLFNDNLNISKPQITDLLKLKKPIIITGTGGSGKSTFLKYLLLDTIQNNKIIPIFVELRNVEQEQLSIIEYIHKNLQLKSVDLDSTYLDQALKNGSFLFLLDGFDELSPKYSKNLSKEIDDISQKFQKCTFIVTSRPGHEFISWSNFIELKTKPLTQEKAISLVKRLNFDAEIKDNFIAELKKDLYNTHRSFFENPLLLSIMLITFRDSASIPSELHNFYALAFESLYYRHDAGKAFKRPTLTKLPVNKGKDVMSAFSLITYLKNQTIFNQHELEQYLKTSTKLSDCECEIKDLIIDLKGAFCMLLQDGTVYQYTHRSFQEYFAACYLISTSDEKQDQLIREFSKRAEADVTLQLAYGMNPKLIEEKLFIPFLSSLKENIGYKGKINRTVFRKFAHRYFSTVEIFDQRATLSVKGDVSQKMYDLAVTKLIMEIYNFNTDFDNKNPYMLEVHDDKKNKLKQKSISIALKDPVLFNWLFNHSLEVRILNDLMKLEEQLKIKNHEKNTLIDSLIPS